MAGPKTVIEETTTQLTKEDKNLIIDILTAVQQDGIGNRTAATEWWLRVSRLRRKLLREVSG
jgi:hypothetical protein